MKCLFIFTIIIILIIIFPFKINEGYNGKGKKDKAEGGRIGLAEGDTPSEAWMRDYFYKAGYDRKRVITLDDYMHGPKGLGWKDYMEHGPGKAKGGRIGYDNGGPVTQEEYDEYVAEKEAAGEEAMDFETYKLTDSKNTKIDAQMMLFLIYFL